ncbi:unnamed protein product [Urochloa humidicola]
MAGARSPLPPRPAPPSSDCSRWGYGRGPALSPLLPRRRGGGLDSGSRGVTAGPRPSSPLPGGASILIHPRRGEASSLHPAIPLRRRPPRARAWSSLAPSFGTASDELGARAARGGLNQGHGAGEIFLSSNAISPLPPPVGDGQAAAGGAPALRPGHGGGGFLLPSTRGRAPAPATTELTRRHLRRPGTPPDLGRVGRREGEGGGGGEEQGRRRAWS